MDEQVNQVWPMRIGLIATLLAALIGLSSGIGAERVTAVAGGDVYAADEIVVKLAPGAAIAEINDAYGTTTIRPLPYTTAIYLLAAPDPAQTLQTVTAMASDGRLQYAEPNFRSAAPEATGVDTYGWGVDTYGWGVDTYGWGVDTYGWGVDTYGWGEDALSSGVDTYGWPADGGAGSRPNPRLLYEWETGSDAAHYYNQPAVQQLQVAEAQAISDGQGVTVAVLDSGVDATHPMLAGYLLPGYDFVDDDATPDDDANGLDDDGDGFVDEITGHGTHVAGIVHLVAPAAQLMPLRVLDSDGQGDSFIIAEAMLYAAANGADVLNMSLGSVWPSTFLLDVVEQVSAQGVLVVAAAGNLDTDIAQYPAAAPCALGVTAVGPGFHKSDFASYGPWVDVAAPGDRIYSTYPGGYSWWRGTSMATPFVSGQAALLLSGDETLTLTAIGQYITGAAKTLHDPDYEGQLGAGRIAIGDSLVALADGDPPADAPDPFQGCAP